MPNFCLLYLLVGLDQGGTASFFLLAKNSFRVGRKGKETPPCTIFEK
jgi:hypothetical protein